METLGSRGATEERTLAHLPEGKWDAANYYPEAFYMELAVWKTITELASEVSTHFRAGRLAGFGIR